MAMKLEELLAAREGEDVEFKKDASSPKGICHEFIALSNKAGGWIVIGVDDDRNVVGLKDPQKTEEAISNAIYSSTEPPQAPVIQITSADNGAEVVLIDVQYFQGPEPLAYKKGADNLVVYERIGSNSVPVKDEKRLERMKLERHGQSGTDQMPVHGATLGDLDMELIEKLFDEQGIKITEAKLEHYELAVKQGKDLIPTLAGIVLFGRDPRKFIPEAYFRAIRYQGDDKASTVLDQDDWPALPLVPALDEVTKFIERNTGTAEILDGRRNRKIPHYDDVVLREVLHNAVAHTDYSEAGRYLNVSIYNDRLEIDSPGSMPPGQTIAQLKQGIGKTRNRAIMATLHALRYVERRGSVYPRSQQAQRERGYPLPEWNEPGGIVKVTIKPHPSASDAAAAESGKPMKRTRKDRRPDIVAFLRKEGEAGSPAIGAALGITGRQARNVLKKMAKEGTVYEREDGGNLFWGLAEQGK
jgi:ATP-dependent DNA helicase RecG